jgi:hypothetical protein
VDLAVAEEPVVDAVVEVPRMVLGGDEVDRLLPSKA